MKFLALLFHALLVGALKKQRAANPVTVAPVPTVEHKKASGNGYLPGSPLYKKQVAVEKHNGATGATGTSTSAGEPAASSVIPGVPAVEPPAPPKNAEEATAAASEAAAKIASPLGDSFPVPTTTKCVVTIVVQYMFIYTVVALIRSYQEIRGVSGGKVRAAFEAASQTLTYGPMLCVLFIACRMRVEFLSDGKDQPQQWVQTCMMSTTSAVCWSCNLVLLIPLLTGKPLPLKDGEPAKPEPGQDSKWVFITLTVIRYLIMISMYGGLIGVIVGINVYMPPGATDLTKLPPPAPAVMCTMILATVYFLIQIVIAVARSYEEFKGVEMPRIKALMTGALSTVEFAPMLAILFLGARMRALQHDGQPQKWAQNCMYASTYALILTTILSIAVPAFMNGTMETDPRTGEKTFTVPNPTLAKVLIGLRYVCLVCVYGGFTAVITSVFMFVAPAGLAATLPISPALQCVMNLTVQYFLCYLLIQVMVTLSELGVVRLDTSPVYRAVEAAKTTVAWCPMLSILFVTTRMYALLLTDKKGAPQAWVQDGMFMATWALLIQFLSCLACGGLMDKVEKDKETGELIQKFANKYVGMGMAFLRYLAMVLQYGGVIIIIVGIFTMTKETANGRGSIPLVSDAVNATPIGNPPPGLNDVPGAHPAAAAAALLARLL